MGDGRPDFLRLSVRPWGLLTAAGLVACAATVFGFFGRYSWFLDLFSNFRVQYVVGLGVLGTVFLVARRRKTGVTFFIFAAINIALIVPLYVGGSETTPGDAPVHRAMLINVNTARGDAQRIREVIEQTNPDILVLEEISARWVEELAWLYHTHAHSRLQPRQDNFGIGIFSRYPMPEREVVYIGDAEVPSICSSTRNGSAPTSAPITIR